METVIPIEFLFKVTTWVWWEWLLCPVTDHFSSQLMDNIEDQILSNPLKNFWTLTCVPCSTHLLCFLCENLKLNPYLNLNYICHLCISIFCNVWLFLNHLLVWKDDLDVSVETKIIIERKVNDHRTLCNGTWHLMADGLSSPFSTYVELCVAWVARLTRCIRLIFRCFHGVLGRVGLATLPSRLRAWQQRRFQTDGRKDRRL